MRINECSKMDLEKNGFLTEMHLHTSESSVCAEMSAADIVRLYHNLGYKTLIITDHMSDWYVKNTPDPKKRIDKFLLGYRAAFSEAGKIGMNVLPAMELNIKTKPNDYLLYGANEEIFYSNPDLPSFSEKELREFAKINGLLIVQAHPFRGECRPASPENIDGVEVWNGHPGWFSPEQSLKAEAFADKYGLIKTAGSDFHGGKCVAGTGLLFPEEIKNWEMVLVLLKTGKFSPIKSCVFE